MGDASLPAPVQIEIGGALTGTLTTGSLFHKSGAQTGAFLDPLGDVTGTLFVGAGIPSGSVVPTS